MAIKIGGILFFASLVIGLYFLNLGLKFVTLSFMVEPLTSWMNVLGGVLLIVGGFFSMRATQPMMMRR